MTKKPTKKKRKPIYTEDEAKLMVHVYNMTEGVLDLLRNDCVRILTSMLNSCAKNPYRAGVIKNNTTVAKAIKQFEKDVRAAIEIVKGKP